MTLAARCFVSLCLCLILASCQRTPPIQIPATASLYVTAARIEHLAGFDEVPDLAGFDPAAPGWVFCEGGVCALGGKPAKGTSPTLDGGDHVVTWTLGAAKQAETLARWRAWEGATLARSHDSGSMLHGHVAPELLLDGLEFEKPRPRELLVEASRQLETLEFDANLVDGDLHATLRSHERAANLNLGSPSGDFPGLGGLVDAGVAGIVRISADPQALWLLARSTASPADRDEIDRFVAAMSGEFGIDLEKDLLAQLTGHFAIVAYTAAKATPAEWLSGAATRETVYVGISDRDAIERLLDAATQLSRGKLNTRRVEGERVQWAWVEDDELQWTLILGDDHAVIVDSVVALEHARDREAGAGSLPESLVPRGVQDLLGGTRRSGLYLDAAAIEALLPPGSRWRELRWMSVVADEDSGEEVVRLKLGGFKKH